jgi:hypothetical protein
MYESIGHKTLILWKKSECLNEKLEGREWGVKWEGIEGTSLEI